MDASSRVECLSGTRTALIDIIAEWAHDPFCTQNVLWLRGLAGSGKSTLATTIANYFRESGHLGAFMFFERDVLERSNPMTVIKTMAYQLGTLHSRVGIAISAAIDDFPSIAESPLRFQFQKLILEPLAISAETESPIVFVLDALDECGTANERETLLEILTEQLTKLPSCARFFFTSRSELDIYSAFEVQPNIIARELEITSDVNAHDISLYLRHQLGRVRMKKMRILGGIEWPTEAQVQQLVERASGLFVWASTASKFIDGYDPRKRIDIILRAEVTSGAEDALDILYRTALETAGSWGDEDFVTDFKAVFGVILVALNPLSSTAIDLLLGQSEERPAVLVVSQLGCVLNFEPTVRFLHPSFADFLTTRSRCGQDSWFFEKPRYNYSLAVQCLQRLTSVLRRNICDMTLSADIADERLPEDVSYACQFWIDHVCVVDCDTAGIVNLLESFIFHHILHWLEAMSILKRSRYAIAQLEKLSSWITVIH